MSAGGLQVQTGEILRGRWYIEQALGLGGTAGVFLARDAKLERRVAIKELLLEENLDQLEREARLLATLDHPNIVRVLDYLDTGRKQYLIMEYIEGHTLESARPSTPGQIWQWTEQLLDALQYLHDRSVVFRDLKPANIMVDAQERVHLIDFGIARACGPQVATASCLRGTGTPGYAPVEQYYGSSTDPRSDVYALGATLYTLLTGHEPPPSVALLSGDATLVPIRQSSPDVPPHLEATIGRMMALRKEDRPQSIAELRMWFAEPWKVQPSAAPALVPCDNVAPVHMVNASIDPQLPYAAPFSILYRGTLEVAQQVLEHSRRVGVPAHLLYACEPTSPRPGGWQVVVAHALSRGL
ncbi:MAG TPA: serine/threonine-protein kinase [Candidatus Xenobia bacterium]|jgi:serine/threonine-protein kinase